MRPLIAITALLVVVQGRPEPPSGYSYNVPSNSFDYSSSHGSHGSVGHSNIGLLLGSGGSGNSYTLASSGSGLSIGGSSFGSSGVGLASSGFGSGIGGGIGFGSGIGGSSVGLSQSSGGIGFGGDGVGASSGGTIVQKHIYVHVPPPETEEFRPQRVIPVAPAQKHYKIIFIKAPTPPTPTVPSIPLQPQDEEKTLVYVLVKKPEDAPEIQIPQAQPTQPSKPEVYFIRYKTQKQSGISGGSLSGGISGASGIAGGSISGDASSIGGDSFDSGLAGGSISSGLIGNSIGSSISSVSSHSGSSSISGSYAAPSGSYGAPSPSYGPPKH